MWTVDGIAKQYGTFTHLTDSYGCSRLPDSGPRNGWYGSAPQPVAFLHSKPFFVSSSSTSYFAVDLYHFSFSFVFEQMVLWGGNQNQNTLVQGLWLCVLNWLNCNSWTNYQWRHYERGKRDGWEQEVKTEWMRRNAVRISSFEKQFL